VAAAEQDITLEQNGTFAMGMRLYDVDDEGVRTAMDLTDHEARMQIRATAGSATALVELTSDPAAGITIGSGRLDIEITDEQCATLPVGVVAYDLVLDKPNGDQMPLLRGTATVEPGITR
jgi:hypothetical protein